MEDVDLCERLIQSGWKIFYLPEAKVMHQAGGSSDQDWERSQTNFFQSVIRYFRKKEGSAGLWLTRISVSFALVIRSLLFLFRAKLSKAWFYLCMSLRILWLN
jgi:GT2 family glycosyltransferase